MPDIAQINQRSKPIYLATDGGLFILTDDGAYILLGYKLIRGDIVIKPQLVSMAQPKYDKPIIR